MSTASILAEYSHAAVYQEDEISYAYINLRRLNMLSRLTTVVRLAMYTIGAFAFIGVLNPILATAQEPPSQVETMWNSLSPEYPAQVESDGWLLTGTTSSGSMTLQSVDENRPCDAQIDVLADFPFDLEWTGQELFEMNALSIQSTSIAARVSNAAGTEHYVSAHVYDITLTNNLPVRLFIPLREFYGANAAVLAVASAEAMAADDDTPEYIQPQYASPSCIVQYDLCMSAADNQLRAAVKTCLVVILVAEAAALVACTALAPGYFICLAAVTLVLGAALALLIAV
jgi:hypothetical protein